MTQEEKAKAYDKAFVIARSRYSTETEESVRICLELMFPELAESDDERIRKEITEFFKNYSVKGTWKAIPDVTKWIAWLEAQGKQKEYTFKSIPRLLDIIEPSDKAKAYCRKLIDTLTNEGYNTDAKIVGEVLNGWNGEDVPMAVMDEQKPADNVEPKFKVGDWVVDKNGAVQEILSYKDCIYKHTNGYSSKMFEDEWRMWDIAKDAKDGDVLSDGTTIFILKDLLSDDSVMSYCDYATDSGKSDAFCPLSMNLVCSKITPATKEQCGQLEKAMADAGYTFDFEKKELKKIVQNPAWNEEDNPYLYGLIGLIEQSKAGLPITLKGKAADNCIDWLKSLKERYTWKPSDEQMDVLLSEVTAWSKGCPKQIILESLYNDLKKLREE